MMPWHGILGHDAVVEQFRRSLAANRLASTFLFVGPSGIGKRTFASKLAQALLCDERGAAELDPCESCPSCHQVRAGTHPDLELVAKPGNRSFIPVERFIGDRDHRMQEGLCHNIALKPMGGKRKVAIIDDADHLNQEGANCLLKTLEEPPPGSVIILIGTSEQRQLPTIRSRCQIVRFRPLPSEVLAELLVATNLVEDVEQARRLTRLAGGSLDRAAEVAEADLASFRAELLESLAGGEWDVPAMCKQVTGFVEAAGKEAAARRARLRQVISQVLEFYRQWMRIQCDAPAECDELLERCITAARSRTSLDVDASVDRCLEALAQVDANANQATLIECWLDDLSLLARGAATDA
jgi:DNA polymerase-3 subunit delta'